SFFTLMRETAPPEARSGRLTAGRPPPRRPPRRAVRAERRTLARLLNVSAWPAPMAAGVCVLLLLLIVLVDVSTGADLQLAPCYFLPIILASLRFQAPGGLVAAGVSAL